MPLDGVERHAAYCCRSLVFNRAAWRVTVEHRLPQALVTVSPDVVLKRIVPEYGLEEIFDVILASCVEDRGNPHRADLREDRASTRSTAALFATQHGLRDSLEPFDL